MDFFNIQNQQSLCSYSIISKELNQNLSRIINLEQCDQNQNQFNELNKFSLRSKNFTTSLVCKIQNIQKILSEQTRSKLLILNPKFEMSTNDNNNPVDIDKIIQRLLQSKGNDVKMEPYQIRQVCIKARDILMQEPMLLNLRAPIKICGDIHGQYRDLLRIFNSGGLPSKQQYLFLGDYVDRGKNSLQCIVLLLCFKIKHPSSFFLLRGNHECSYINRLYGFYDECKRRSNLKIFKIFVDVFNFLPIAAVVNKRIICMHGGLSPQIKTIDEIQKLQRPIQIPENGPVCDLLWSDPDKSIKGWEENLQRGVSYVFGVDVIQNFLKSNDLDVVCRAHQVVQQGFEFVGNRKLVTLFSAPNYCGMFDNDGAFMNVDQKLVCSFSIIKNRQSNKENQEMKENLPKEESKNETSKKLTKEVREKLFK